MEIWLLVYTDAINEYLVIGIIDSFKISVIINFPTF